MQFRITEKDDDGYDIYLGSVKSPPSLNQKQAEGQIIDAWDDFKATEPEADSEFIQFLVDRYTFTAVKDEVIDIVLDR
jgi:hypothetical protein